MIQILIHQTQVECPRHQVIVFFNNKQCQIFHPRPKHLMHGKVAKEINGFFSFKIDTLNILILKQ